MTDFNAFAPNYSAPADPLAGFHEPILLRGGREEEGEGEGTGGREGEGVGKKGRGCPVFSLSRPVNPISTTHALVG